MTIDGQEQREGKKKKKEKKNDKVNRDKKRWYLNFPILLKCENSSPPEIKSITM